MPTMKDTAITLIRKLPAKSTFEDIQYHLYVREKIDRGIAAVKAGRVVSQELAEQRVKQWSKSSGRSPR